MLGGFSYIRKALLERFGTARAALAAAPSELREVQGIGPKLTHKIAGADHEIDVEAEIALCREHGIDIITEGHAAYPIRTNLRILVFQ